MRSEHSISIRRPPSAVFDFVADPGTWKRWALRVVEVRREHQGPLRLGERFTVLAKLYGRQVPMTYEVTELEGGRRLVWRSVSGVAGEGRFIFSVEAAPDGARLTERVEIEPRGLFRLLAPLIERTSNRQLAANHAALKKALEG